MSGNALVPELLVGALLRRAESAGGFGTVLLKGNPYQGIILVQCLDKGRFCGIFERLTDLEGKQSLVRCGPSDEAQNTEINDYISKRRRSDPDFWLIELDVADGQRLAAETLC